MIHEEVTKYEWSDLQQCLTSQSCEVIQPLMFCNFENLFHYGDSLAMEYILVAMTVVLTGTGNHGDEHVTTVFGGDQSTSH